MFDVKGWISRRRYGGITGLNQMDSNIKMLGVATAPLLLIVVINQFFIINTPLAEFTGLITMFGLGAEALWVGVLMARAKAEVNSLIVFPQAHVRWPDGSSSWFDFKATADNIQQICKYTDGSRGYRIQFLDRYEHQDKKMPFPYVFTAMNWKVPAEWADTFERLSQGEVFHGNVFVDHGSCEPTTIWVKEIPETENGFEPLCLIADSSFQYKQWMRNNGHETGKVDLYLMPFRRAQAKVHDLLEHLQTLETALQVERESKGKRFKGQVSNTVNTIREGVHDIDDTGEPLLRRIFNWSNIWKAMLVSGFLLLVLWLVGVIRF